MSGTRGLYRRETSEAQKKAAALAAAAEIGDGMLLGLGTGSTVRYLVERVGELVRDGMDLTAVVTSVATGELAAAFHIPLLSVNELSHVDLAIDGVDALTPDFDAVKGGGGALFREKMIAGLASRVVWILDESKLYPHLSAVPLPVEIVPFGFERTREAVEALGFSAVLRMAGTFPYLTDNGNYILDLTGTPSMDYRRESRRLKLLNGVVETGFFGRFCENAIVGTSEGVKILRAED